MSTEQPPAPYRLGGRVNHGTFGPGVVTGWRPDGMRLSPDDTGIIKVEFDRHGSKELLLAFARRLEPTDDN